MPAAPRVKICGFTRMEDVDAACRLGCDALGFNLAQGPRRIAFDLAAALTRRVPPFATTVALFVDAGEDEILTAMAATRCQVAQLHGDEPPELAEGLMARFPVIKAFRVRDAAALDRVAGYPADAYLLDAYVPIAAGGSGRTWDHALLSDRDLGRPLILAGGLTPVNVGTAITALRPWAVDTASGVESTPGIKDPVLMAAFIQAAHGMA